MDLLLPDEECMERMRLEFEKRRAGEMARAAVSALKEQEGGAARPERNAQNSLHMCKNDENCSLSPCENDGLCDRENGANFPSPEGAHNAAKQKLPRHILLYLYFIRVLGYNMRYGTQIYDAPRSVGGLQSVERSFGELNDLFRN